MEMDGIWVLKFGSDSIEVLANIFVKIYLVIFAEKRLTKKVFEAKKKMARPVPPD